MTRLLYLLLALLAAIPAVSARTIQGTVLSSSDSTAVVGANCRLMAGDKLIEGATADADGAFSLSTDSRDALTLEISMTGYSPTDILIEAGGKNINAGTVYLDEGIALGELNVTAQSVIQGKGRTIVYPSSSEVKASSTSISLFQKLPLAGLDANPINRTLTIDGGAPVILINGIPSDITDVNALQPKDIERIEYSRFTPARYADKGGKGFINIILKKRTDGGQIYAWGRSAVSTAFVDGNIRASYHQAASQFTLSYNPSWRNYQRVYDNITESYISPDYTVELKEHDRNPFYYHTHNMRLKYDYSPSSRTLFSATFSATPNYSKRTAYADSYSSVKGSYYHIDDQKSADFSPTLDLFLRQDFNDRNSLEVQVVGTLSSSDYRRSNSYFFTVPNGPGMGGASDVNHYIMNVDSRRRSLISEVSYIHNFSQNTTLSAGFQNTVSHSTNKYLDSDYKPVLTENNNYVYARLGQNFGPVYLSLSTGAKLFWIENDQNKRHFIRNISTAYASWTISPRWSLAAAFQYTPGIPSLSALTDHPQQSTPYLVSNGNPDLKVSENFRYQFMPSFQYKKFNTSLLMNLSQTRNFVMDDVVYMGNHLFLSQSINARKSWYAGANLNMQVRDIAGFGASINLGLDHYETMGDGWSHHLTSFDASFSLWWNRGPFTISYWRKVPGKYLSGHLVGKDENGDSLQFEYKPDKHWTLGASWMYMFDVKGTKYPSWNYSSVNPSERERYIKNNGNMVVLSVSYSADFGSIFRTGRRSLNNSDNTSSLLKL